MKSRSLQAVAPFVALVAASQLTGHAADWFLPAAHHRDTSTLLPRADCKYRAVVEGDGCGTLATKCGISAADFTKYNPNLDCSKLQIDDWVCCSSGTLPSKRPVQNPDGSCFSQPVVDGSYCGAWEKKYDVTEAEINKWNANTWRWTNCTALQIGQSICLSTGTAPLPPQNASIPCGLEAIPRNKECPLNACCGKWGYCGLTDDFCEKVTGAPGLGCQSHCEKINSFDNVGKTSGSYGRNIIGYYSNWSAKRKCNGVPQDVLPAVRPSDLDANSFSHIVYSFAGVDLNGKLYETDTNDKALIAELQALKKTNSNLKTMWAVGGWAFNDPPTQEYFSINMRTSASRAKFISNIISQLKSYGFDGIDIDWEYPGTERGGIADDGKNFLAFLKELKAASKSIVVSFTAPASYWYLQQFPIKEMQDYTDWINLMTYDIHGSWDIKFDTGVLPHTSFVEVNTAVNMLLKAGVRLNKINLGIGFYGRTFTLADPSCKVGGCPMSGPGTQGPCTQADGFLSYGEIEYMIESRGLNPTYNKTSKTMTLVDGNQWIGYEDATTLAQKLKYVLDRTMPGVLIWAVDLDRNNKLLSAVVGHSLAPQLSDMDCPADGVWPRTKPGNTANVPCAGKGSNGPFQTRLCGGPKWGDAQGRFCSSTELMLKAFGSCSAIRSGF